MNFVLETGPDTYLLLPLGRSLALPVSCHGVIVKYCLRALLISVVYDFLLATTADGRHQL